MNKSATNWLILAFLLVSGIFATSAFRASAQQPTPQGTPASAAVSTATPAASTAVAMPSPSPSPAPSPKVIGITGHLELDDVVRVEVAHFTEWSETHDATKLVPFINGRAIRGNYPEEISSRKNRLHFHLEITPETRKSGPICLARQRARAAR